MREEAGENSRFITLELSQAEYDVLTDARITVQAEIRKELTWVDFVLELARRTQ